MESKLNQAKRRGFSLIELVIVVVIIGIIGAIAIPRLSRGAEGASDAALSGDLAVLRNAIDLFATEHKGTYPSLASIEAQLTQYSDVNGTTSAAKTGNFIYGPYIRKVPALKVGSQSGSSTFTDTEGTPGAGWVYNATTGTIVSNTSSTEKDATGKLYSDY